MAEWWRRALCQLSALSVAKQETVNIGDLLVQFLNANRVAIQNSTRVGWEFDKALWTDISDRIRRRDPELEAKKEFRATDQDLVKQIVKRVADQVQSKAGKDQTTSTQVNATTAGGLPQTGKGGKIQDTWQPARGGKATQYAQGGTQWPGGKGSGKPWGKDWGKDAAKGGYPKGPGKPNKDKVGKGGVAKKVKQEK